MNFIEGIDRVVVVGTGKSALIVLNGKFALNQLKNLAVSDGGTVKPINGELCFPRKQRLRHRLR